MKRLHLAWLGAMLSWAAACNRGPVPGDDAARLADASADRELRRDALASCAPCVAPKNKTCFTGRVYPIAGLARWWAGEAEQPSPMSSEDGIVLRVYDLFELAINPKTARALTTVDASSGGCFTSAAYDVPYSGAIAIAIESSSGSPDAWAATTVFLKNVAFGGMSGLEIAAIPQSLAEAWAKVWRVRTLLRFVDETGSSVAGVSVVDDGQQALYLDTKVDQAPYFIPGGTATGKTGLAAVAKGGSLKITGGGCPQVEKGEGMRRWRECPT